MIIDNNSSGGSVCGALLSDEDNSSGGRVCAALLSGEDDGSGGDGDVCVVVLSNDKQYNMTTSNSLPWHCNSSSHEECCGGTSNKNSGGGVLIRADTSL